MKPEQFIREFGVEKAREVVAGRSKTYMPELFKYWSEELNDYVLAPKYASFLVEDLKRLVESLDLVKKLGGIHIVKEWFKKNGNAPLHQKYLAFSGLSRIDCFSTDHYGAVHASRVKQAIRDHESIYGEE